MPSSAGASTSYSHTARSPLPSALRSFQFREQCNKCGIDKSAGIPVPAGPGYGGAGAGYGAPAPGYGGGGGYGPPPGAGYGGHTAGLQPGQTIKPGDWRCTSCGNIK